MGGLFGKKKDSSESKSYEDSTSVTPSDSSDGGGGDAVEIDLPEEIVKGANIKFVPEKIPGRPRTWQATVEAIEKSGFWIEVSDEQMPVIDSGDTLSLLLYRKSSITTFECPVLTVRKTKKALHCFLGPGKDEVLNEESSHHASRQHIRVSFRLPAQIYLLSDPEKKKISCYTRDISLGGIALEVEREFELETPLHVRILSWNFPLKVDATVMRCFKDDNGKYAIGLSFPSDMSSVSRDLVSQFIQNNQRNSTL